MLMYLPRVRGIFRSTCVSTWVKSRLAEAEDDAKDDEEDAKTRRRLFSAEPTK